MSVHGFGISDIEGASKTRAYRRWSDILKRCYSKNALERNPTYEKTTVCDEWRYFSKFKEWFDENFVEGWDIDKDIVGGDVYSPETAMFVPKWLNTFIVGADKSRGEFPIGVNFDKSRNKYRAQCRSFGNKRVHAGYHETVSDAHKAWLNKKLSILSEKKEVIDSIDTKLYDLVVNKIKRMV